MTTRFRRPHWRRSPCDTTASIASRLQRPWRCAVAPLKGIRMRGYNHNILINGSSIFQAKGLDIDSDKTKWREVICPTVRSRCRATSPTASSVCSRNTDCARKAEDEMPAEAEEALPSRKAAPSCTDQV